MPKIKNSANKDQYQELNGPALNAQKEEEMSTLQKISGTLRRLFVSEKKVPPQISDAVVAGTYFQIAHTINIILLYTLFSGTNSQIYSLVITILSILLILIDILPKISKKHLVFSFVCISEALILAGILISSKILIDNFSIFSSNCQDFAAYHERRRDNPFRTSASYLISEDRVTAMCSEVLLKFKLEIAVECLFVFGKIIHLAMYVRAYRLAKVRYEEEEKKRRRKDRYNEMMRKRYVYNDKKRV